ncbi:MAG TPA: L,D-transpeptidase family protein [Gaiellaceae bacterium]|nr:L,D-transpeptidase family protein [Gaiellaceae bacterium]
MKRLHAVGLFVLGLAAAGAFSGAVIADVTTSTSTTTTDVTTTAPVTTTTSAPPANVLPAGVRVAGVRVGGLSPAEAVQAVREAFARPLPVVVDRTRLLLDPTRVATAYAPTAVARGRIAEPGASVRLVVSVRGAAVRTWVAAIEKRFARTAGDARLTFRNAKPVVSKEKLGRKVDVKALTRRVIAALNRNTRLPVRVHTRAVPAKVTSSSFDDVIVINRETNRLYLYDEDKLERSFPVATGQAIYPTPRGLWHIVVMWKNPWWYPPVNDTWAKGLKPVPPGPGNPLGTRWMGLDSPGVGIHGTDDPASIGYSASHGCIRMQVPDAEWLFDHVDVGTTVYIV